MKTSATGRWFGLPLLLALCCGAAAGPPALALHSPWVIVDTPLGEDGERPVAEWVLPDGMPDPQPRDLQYLEVWTKDLDPGGLGGYVAQRVATFDPKYVKNLHYAPIETCLRPAWLFTFDDSFTGDTRTFEVVYFAVGETLYSAEYLRPVAQAEDAIAHAAIVDFCNTHGAKKS